MAVIKLHSTNPNFSYIIVKNPNTQIDNNAPFKRSLRKGMLYGWFNSPSDNPITFNMWFKDADKLSSFSSAYDQQFEYLDKSRYNSPFIVVHAINEMLRSAVAATHDPLDVDDQYTCSLELPCVEMPIRRLNNTIQTFKECSITMIELVPGSSVYYFRIETSKSIYWMLHFVRLLFLLHSSQVTDGYFERSDEVVVKFANSLNVINAPYYYRYLFNVWIVPSDRALKQSYDLIAPPNMTMNFGNTAQHRMAEVKSHLIGGNVLYDLGCGEIKYTRKLQKLYDSVYSVDVNEHLQEINERKIKSSAIENVTIVTQDILEFLQTADSATLPDILLTEVLEHMQKEHASLVLETIAQAGNYSKCVITVPNKEFNKYYSIPDDQLRIEDHMWEPTMEEFVQFINQHFKDTNTVSIHGLGDTVDGIPASLIAVITKGV
jgi:cyclopropane fatty-acyl-phospholipid synthase-like methyltransferase